MFKWKNNPTNIPTLILENNKSPKQSDKIVKSLNLIPFLEQFRPTWNYLNSRDKLKVFNLSIKNGNK